MALIKIYFDESTKEVVILGVSKEFPNNYEVTYDSFKVYIKNLTRWEYDIILNWQDVADINGNAFNTFQEVKNYLTDGVNSIFKADVSHIDFNTLPMLP